MVMDEKISRLMDGDCDAAELDAACVAMKSKDALLTWVCYHAIGDVLRGQRGFMPGFEVRFAARFAQEPTVLAPVARAPSRAATWAFAAAATMAAVTVVGWTAFTLYAEPPAVVAKAREANSVRAAQLRPSGVPAEFLLAHQEYSPSTALQGVGPYVRAVVVQGDARQ
jgi:sigma-E factor negative regulatory protein RseA